MKNNFLNYPDKELKEAYKKAKRMSTIMAFNSTNLRHQWEFKLQQIEVAMFKRNMKIESDE